MSGCNVIVAGVGRWTNASFEKWPGRKRHRCCLVQDPQQLAEALARTTPDVLFFVHWSWKIPRDIYERYECVGFHMTDLPFGRGGSPLQNLLVRGIHETVLTAFRIDAGLDTGPMYLKRKLGLEGRAFEIYARAATLALSMIDEILERRPEPQPQIGMAVTFKRRTPRESEIPEGMSLVGLYDFIRMLDADGYPPAFVLRGGYRLEFSNAAIESDAVRAQVAISLIETEFR